jgi:hypothetical protein
MNKKESSKTYIACCGAYCKTCKPYNEGHCKGCKIGYESGERDINKTKCKIKLCCFRDNKFHSCADCSKLESCNIVGSMYAKKGYKYKKYKESLEFIKENGYPKFIKLANKWKEPYGKLE